ncbi:gamma-glutamyltransferase family protein [Roseomonas frigidaquae]|uniref:Gamma-glutamyltransferase family protein n=1 Tax=Falsiroseomonas frigidaquae TaxID=487318 RepID=A0ABX1F559_9PROT|nr:gamma-glutamyltransferase [Falsiroseomonas frigidaquae]NKE47425.1 gamma-glutamyltransferase family protein [Falsiroseomonas frigidaquae]
MTQPGRPTISGTRHAISAGHYLAASAGFAILEAGGNAVDAGVAAGLALGVLQPDLVSVAGVAPILIRKADGTVESIAGLGHWPRSTPPDVFMREHGGQMPPGVRRMVVPAAPDAWIQALSRHGTMSFGEIAAAAIRFAGEGYAMYPLLRESITAHAAEYRTWEQNAAIFLPGGKVPEPGAKFIQADLARSLSYMVDQERAAAGKGREAGLQAAHDAFYKGDLARQIVAYVQAEGGFLSADDMAEFRSRIEPVVARDWRGHTLLTCGPWCQGPALTEALLIAERLGLDGLAHNSAEYIHVLVEALKGALADREYHFGDPAMVDVPLEALLSPGHIAARAAAIDLKRAHPGLPEPILGRGNALPEATHADLPKVEADTSYVAVVDRWGNAFSATPSDGSWNVPIIPGTGLVVSGRGSQNRPDPKHPAGVAPGKRPRLTPNPAMVVTKDGGAMPFGTPGGDVQIQAMLQVMLNILHFGMEVQEAIEAPRVASYSFPSSFAPYEYFPGRLAVESRIPAEVRAKLAEMGHEVKDWPGTTWLAGSVEVVLDDVAAGLKRAGADPRRPAYAIAI